MYIALYLMLKCVRLIIFQDVHFVRVDVLRLLNRGADGQVHQARARRLEAGVLLQRVRQERLVQRQEPLR